MQAVILAAGRGTRMKELTEGTPKSLLQVAGRPLLTYALDALPDSVDEVIIIVGYLGGMIHDRLGPEYYGKRILYVEQEQLNGTAGALWLAKDILKGRFLVLNGDGIYAVEDLKKMAEAKEWALLVKEVSSLGESGEVIVENGIIVRIAENTGAPSPGLANAGVYALDTRLFAREPVSKSEGSPEFGLPQTALTAAEALKIPLEAVQADVLIHISSPEDLQKAEETLRT